MKKLFLLDAYALIYRAYYAFIKNPRINSKGVNTSAIFGFINTLEDVIKKENPTHIAVGFDPAGPTFRHEAFEKYKAQRESTPEVIKESVPVIKEIIKAYNIPILEVPGYEADDVIGTISKQAEKKGFVTFMMTPDKDYGQLVSENIFIYKPKYGSTDFAILGIKEVKEKYGLSSPEQMIDLLSLMGDSSDNIPGCPGIGEKTAIKLLDEFGSVDSILKNIPLLKGSVKTKIENNIEEIQFSKFLATIKTDVPISFDEKLLEKEEPNKNELIKIFNELEFKNLTTRIFNEEKKTTVKNHPQQGDLFSIFEANPTEEKKYSTLEDIKSTEHTYYLVDNEEKKTKLLHKFSNQHFFCFDTETTGINPFSSQLVGISFSFQEGEAFYLPIPKNESEAQQLLNEFKPVFENPEIEKIGQHIKFDLMMLKNYNIHLQGKLFDTMIAHYLIQPEMRHGMDFLAEIYLNYKTIHIEELIGAKGKNQLSMGNLSPEQIYEYACEDADITLKLKHIFEKKLTENQLENLFYNIEIPLIPVLAEMELNGVLIDTEALKKFSVTLNEEISKLEKEIYNIAGIEFNINSAKQVGEVLFEKMKIIEKAKKTKTGQYSTSEDVLESLRSKHPIVEKILEQRGLKKLISTYVDALPLLIEPKTGHIHTSFNQTVTATGRLSSSNPNLQNIPIRDELGKEIRKAFIPEKNSYFLSCDYSQIELRVMAHLSQDKNMIDAFLSGYDIHAATAAKIFKVNISDVTSDMRRKAKTANFGIIYGISIFGLGERLNIPRTEAKELIDGYFETYPQVKSYMDKSIKIAQEKGYVETLFNRKRFLPDINSQNSVVRGFAERNAINAPIQGTAADIIKIAMIKIHERFKKENFESKMILQVHDELNFSVTEQELEQVKNIIIEEMEAAIKLTVPLKVEAGIGKNWLEAH